MLSWCLNIFKKIVAKPFNKSLKLLSSQGRLRESIRREWPLFWKDDDWYLLHDNKPTHRSYLIRVLCRNSHLHPTHSTNLASCDICLFPSMEKYLRGTSFCAIKSKSSIAEGLTEGYEKWLPEVTLLQAFVYLAKGYVKGGYASVLRIIQNKVYLQLVRNFGSHYVNLKLRPTK
ncbi:hypothetical protein TNCV_3011751 [Trichonephila clavipes]|nr:hypothetical protein TNCV_3011751 [Trichonephila clavipes]